MGGVHQRVADPGEELVPAGDLVLGECLVMGRAANNYPQEFKDRAEAMVAEVCSEYSAIDAVAKKLGIGIPEI